MLLKAISLLSVLPLTICGPVPPNDNLVVHEQREEAPPGFSKGEPAPPDQVVKLRLALVQGDMATLEQKLYDVSTPSSDLYGQHLSKEEVEAFVRPTAETTSSVTNWLKSNNLQFNQTSPAGDWLSVSLPVSQANTLFNTTLSVFTHTPDYLKGRKVITIANDMAFMVYWLVAKVPFPRVVLTAQPHPASSRLDFNRAPYAIVIISLSSSIMNFQGRTFEWAWSSPTVLSGDSNRALREEIRQIAFDMHGDEHLRDKHFIALTGGLHHHGQRDKNGVIRKWATVHYMDLEYQNVHTVHFYLNDNFVLEEATLSWNYKINGLRQKQRRHKFRNYNWREESM